MKKNNSSFIVLFLTLSLFLLKADKAFSAKISLSDYIKYYSYSYADTFTSALSALSTNNIAISSFNSSKGQVKAKVYNKELFILVAAVKNNETLVRITPTDGIYNISPDIVNNIFQNIKLELTKY